MINDDQTSNNQVDDYPWDDKEISYGLKLLIMFGFTMLLLLCVIPFGIAPLFELPLLFSETNEIFLIGLVPILISLGLFAVSIILIVFLWRYITTPTRFNPSYGVVLPTKDGHPFDVRFGRYRTTRSFNGKGTASFLEDQLRLDGTLEPTIVFQLGIVVVVTVIPLILFGVGLGLILALILAYALGKTKGRLDIPYNNLDLVINGREVVISRLGESPSKLKFRVAASDGERLYREIAHHYPKGITKWETWLKKNLSIGTGPTDPRDQGDISDKVEPSPDQEFDSAQENAG